MIVPLPLPEAELNESQAALSLAVQFSDPFPPLLTAILWLGGLPPPATDENARPLGERTIEG
jgi:hypothetical protein